VVQGDADTDLADYPDAAFDVVILSNTLQAMQRPAAVLAQLVRIGRCAVVSFPNFGHWRVRASLTLSGRMPVTRSLPVSWHETPNIHFCTIADFEALALAMGLTVQGRTALSAGKPVALWPNLLGDTGVFVLRR